MTSQDVIDGWIACADLAIAQIQTRGIRYAIHELQRLRKNGEDWRFLMAEIRAGRTSIESALDTFVAGMASGPSPAEIERESIPVSRRRSPSAIADWLLVWLTARESDVLPRMIHITAECPETNSYYDIDSALRTLSRQGKIAWRSGTRSLHRGHSAIRVIATGRVLKTANCPFDPPETDSR